MASLDNCRGVSAVTSLIGLENEEHQDKRWAVLVLRPSGVIDRDVALSNFPRTSSLHRLATQGALVFTETMKGELGEIGKLARQAARRTKSKSLDAIVFSVHSCATTLFTGPKSGYSIDDVDESDFQALHKDGVVIIMGCSAGQKFAPALARKVHRTVFASEKRISGSNCFPYFCEDHLQFEMTANVPCKSFFPGGQTGKPCSSFEVLFPIHKTSCLSLARKFKKEVTNDATTCIGIAAMLFESPEESDKPAALEWLIKAAKLGNAGCAHDAALCYEHGVGCAKNLTLAFSWHLIAANRGLDKAQHSVGQFLEEGISCKRSKKAAQFWYKKAAAQGHAGAKSALSEPFSM